MNEDQNKALEDLEKSLIGEFTKADAVLLFTKTIIQGIFAVLAFISAIIFATWASVECYIGTHNKMYATAVAFITYFSAAAGRDKIRNMFEMYFYSTREKVVIAVEMAKKGL